MQDFVNYVRGQETSISGTTLSDSIYGHAVAFAADIAMQEKRLVDLSEVLV